MLKSTSITIFFSPLICQFENNHNSQNLLTCLHLVQFCEIQA
jgi:hypothetical protein